MTRWESFSVAIAAAVLLLLAPVAGASAQDGDDDARGTEGIVLSAEGASHSAATEPSLTVDAPDAGLVALTATGAVSSVAGLVVFGFGLAELTAPRPGPLAAMDEARQQTAIGLTIGGSIALAAGLASCLIGFVLLVERTPRRALAIRLAPAGLSISF